MKMFLISDNIDTLTGMRLAGVDGVVVHEKTEFTAALGKVLLDESIAIVLITALLTKLAPEAVSEIKLNRKSPLVLEIPDRHGAGKSADFITHYIKESIGLKI